MGWKGLCSLVIVIVSLIASAVVIVILMDISVIMVVLIVMVKVILIAVVVAQLHKVKYSAERHSTVLHPTV